MFDNGPANLVDSIKDGAITKVRSVCIRLLANITVDAANEIPLKVGLMKTELQSLKNGF